MEKDRKSTGNTFWVVWILLFITFALAIRCSIDFQDRDGNITAAQAQIRNFKIALDMYKSKFERYPESLEKLVRNDSKEKFMEGNRIPLDPWGNPYVYWSDGARFKIVSRGCDGREGGKQLNADIESDKVGPRE